MSFLAKADELIAGRYRLLRCIGEGGMGGVWEATDQVLGCPIALKLVREKLLEGDREQQVQRFLREARIAAQVQHPAVVRVTDFGVHEDTPYIAMELLEGESLADRMYRLPFLDIEEAVQICIGILRGLCAAHKAGIVHRDIKPENVQLVSAVEGLYPKLIDFGISLGTDRNNRRVSAVTTNGHVFGTPLYMSPEHARGSDIDGRADVYSLGIVLYEMLARRPPFTAESPADMMAAIVRDVPVPPCEVRPVIPKKLSDAVMKALSKDPNDRFATANEMAMALAAGTPSVRLDTTGPVMLNSGVHRISGEAVTLFPAPPKRERPLGIALVLSLIVLGVGTWLLVDSQVDVEPATAVDAVEQTSSTENDTSAEATVVPEAETPSLPEAALLETSAEAPDEPISEQAQPQRVRPRATDRGNMQPEPNALSSTMSAASSTMSTRSSTMSTRSFRQLDY